MKLIACVSMFLLLSIFNGVGQENRFPLKIDGTGRYLVDQNDIPFFYQAETSWMIFQNLDLHDVEWLLDTRKNQGFTVIQAIALPFNPKENGENVFGIKPFESFDISKPVIEYFEHIKKGIKIAESKGLAIAMSSIWKGCCGEGWRDILSENGVEKSRIYGEFLGEFFSDCKNILWIQGGDNDPREHIDHYRQIAIGIKKYMPLALQTYHASSGHTSTDVIPYIDHAWLDFSFTYTYFPEKKGVWIHELGFGKLPEVYAMNHREYQKFPVMPLMLGEAQYEREGGVEKPFSDPAICRRQAYWSMLSGGFGHAYGSWNWPVNTQKDWKSVALDEGANQMKWLKLFFEKISWHKLIPDLKSAIITSGNSEYGSSDYIIASATPDYQEIAVYIPPSNHDRRTFTLDRKVFGKNAEAYWFDPSNGEYSKINTSTSTKSDILFNTPGKNSAGESDWLLLVVNAK